MVKNVALATTPSSLHNWFSSLLLLLLFHRSPSSPLPSSILTQLVFSSLLSFHSLGFSEYWCVRERAKRTNETQQEWANQGRRELNHLDWGGWLLLAFHFFTWFSSPRSLPIFTSLRSVHISNRSVVNHCEWNEMKGTMGSGTFTQHSFLTSPSFVRLSCWFTVPLLIIIPWECGGEVANEHTSKGREMIRPNLEPNLCFWSCSYCPEQVSERSECAERTHHSHFVHFIFILFPLTPLIICTERSELVQISKESEGSEVSDNGNRERHAFPLYHFTLLMIKEQNGNRER